MGPKKKDAKRLFGAGLLTLVFILTGCSKGSSSGGNRIPNSPSRSSLNSPLPSNLYSSASPNASSVTAMQGYPEMDPFRNPSFWQKRSDSYVRDMTIAAKQADQINRDALDARQKEQQDIQMIASAVGQLTTVAGGMISKTGAKEAVSQPAPGPAPAEDIPTF